jgi:hypothetical protein
MANIYDAAARGRVLLIMAYRTVLTIIFCLGLFTLSASFLFSSSQHQLFAQSSSFASETSITPTTNGSSNQTMNLDAAKEQYLTVWNQTGFNIVFDTYVEPDSATAYGIYEEIGNNNTFRPGETMVLYIEPVGFGHRQILDDQGNTQYLMNFTADFLIADANGNELLAFEDVPLGSIASYRQNTELFLELTITQDQPFPVGDYMITYIIHDQVSGESLEIDKRITISDSATATNSPTTGSPALPEDGNSIQQLSALQ